MTKKKTLSTKNIIDLSNIKQYSFPKYTTQLINTINANAQGTRPKVVGQMSDLIQEFDGRTLEEWIQWYDNKMPDAIDKATDKIWAMYEKMRDAFDLIDKPLIKEWVKDLVYTKTYCGLKFQDAIIAYIAKELKKEYKKSTPSEEAQGIDGYIGDVPVQIKSDTYKLENKLQEHIAYPIVYYKKSKSGVRIEYDPSDFSDPEAL